MSSDIGDDIFCLSLATGVVELLIGISTPKKLQPIAQALWMFIQGIQGAWNSASKQFFDLLIHELSPSLEIHGVCLSAYGSLATWSAVFVTCELMMVFHCDAPYSQNWRLSSLHVKNVSYLNAQQIQIYLNIPW